MIPESNLLYPKHPIYDQYYKDWFKWRLTYNGGTSFIDRYLVEFSNRETTEDFNKRKEISYSPSFAKAAINEIKNAIFQRLSEVTRLNGPNEYKELLNNIDGKGSSLDYFIGNKVLPELLILSCVGIYIDRERLEGPLLRDAKGKLPYCYIYKREDILSWERDRQGRIVKLLLKDCNYVRDEKYNLPTGMKETYRYLYINDEGFVVVRLIDGEVESEEVLTLKTIPFVMPELNGSLLEDIADYQIALLNMASSDINFILKANFPFYTEQVDPRSDSSLFGERGEAGDGTDESPAVTVKTVKLGSAAGRTYGINLEQPAFIHPSSEPITASMAKQDKCKEEIRLLLNLAISNLKPSKAISAQAKVKDEASLENGLSYIGLELENTERQMAKIICEYVAAENDTSITYPEKYSLKTEEERRLEAESLGGLVKIVPSQTFKKAVCKIIAGLTLRNRVHEDVFVSIDAEIDKNEVIIDHETLQLDVESGITSREFASTYLGYPTGVVAAALSEHEKLNPKPIVTEPKKPNEGA